MDVEGRNQWFNQKVRFGPYHTGKVKRGWITTTQTRFIRENFESKHKFSFPLYIDSGDSSIVCTTGEINLSSITLGFEDHPMQIVLPEEDVFAGSMLICKNREEWEFVLYNANKTDPFKKSTGELFNGRQAIRIEEEQRIANGKKC